MVPSKEMVKRVVEDLQNWETFVLKQSNDEKTVKEMLETFGNELGNEMLENGKNLITLYSQLNAIVSKRFIEIDYDLNKLKELEARAYDILIGVLTLIGRPTEQDMTEHRKIVNMIKNQILNA